MSGEGGDCVRFCSPENTGLGEVYQVEETLPLPEPHHKD